MHCCPVASQYVLPCFNGTHAKASQEKVFLFCGSFFSVDNIVCFQAFSVIFMLYFQCENAIQF